MQAVDRFGQQAGAGGFASTARAAKQVSVTQPLCDHAVLQRSRHVFLTNYIIKAGGPPFTIQSLGHGASLTSPPPPDKQAHLLFRALFNSDRHLQNGWFRHLLIGGCSERANPCASENDQLTSTCFSNSRIINDSFMLYFDRHYVGKTS